MKIAHGGTVIRRLAKCDPVDIAEIAPLARPGAPALLARQRDQLRQKNKR